MSQGRNYAGLSSTGYLEPGDGLRGEVYKFAALLPIEERFNLADQLRRAAVSVPLNIAEGAGSSTKAEFGRFLGYAYRSLKEIITSLELSQRLYPSLRDAGTHIDEGNQISRMIYSLIQKVAPRGF